MQDFASFFAPGPEWAALPTSPSVDMRELEDAYELTMVQPGLTPESLDVRLNGRLLSLHSGQDVQSANRHSHQRFTTQLLLPGPVDPDCAPEIQTENNRIRIRVAKPGGDALAAAAPEVAPADPTAAERK